MSISVILYCCRGDTTRGSTSQENNNRSNYQSKGKLENRVISEVSSLDQELILLFLIHHQSSSPLTHYIQGDS